MVPISTNPAEVDYGIKKKQQQWTYVLVIAEVE